MRLTRITLCLILVLSLSITVSAHPGRTDSNGGHTDHDTGEYHYHHGYPAHYHRDMDGDGDLDCPYDFDDKTNHSSGASGGSGGSSSTNNPPENNKPPNTGTGSSKSEVSHGVHPLLWIIIIGVAVWFGVSKVHGWIVAQKREKQIQENNLAVLRSLGAEDISIPRGIKLLPDGTPITGQSSGCFPYGGYTVFISPSGRKFHKRIHCCRSLSAIHLFKLPREYTPCRSCASGMPYPVVLPIWYKNLLARQVSKPVNPSPDRNTYSTIQRTQSETEANERLLKILKIGAGAEDVDNAITMFSAFYLRKGVEIPNELYLGVSLLTTQEKCANLLNILELGTGVTGIENVTRRLMDFYKAKGIAFPDDVL